MPVSCDLQVICAQPIARRLDCPVYLWSEHPVGVSATSSNADWSRNGPVTLKRSAFAVARLFLKRGGSGQHIRR